MLDSAVWRHVMKPLLDAMQTFGKQSLIELSGLPRASPR